MVMASRHERYSRTRRLGDVICATTEEVEATTASEINKTKGALVSAANKFPTAKVGQRWGTYADRLDEIEKHVRRLRALLLYVKD